MACDHYIKFSVLIQGDKVTLPAPSTNPKQVHRLSRGLIGENQGWFWVVKRRPHLLYIKSTIVLFIKHSSGMERPHTVTKSTYRPRIAVPSQK